MDWKANTFRLIPRQMIQVVYVTRVRYSSRSDLSGDPASTKGLISIRERNITRPAASIIDIPIKATVRVFEFRLFLMLELMIVPVLLMMVQLPLR
jgi:hypothetical protein